MAVNENINEIINEKAAYWACSVWREAVTSSGCLCRRLKAVAGWLVGGGGRSVGVAGKWRKRYRGSRRATYRQRKNMMAWRVISETLSVFMAAKKAAKKA